MAEETLLVYGADWCGDCRRTKRFLNDNQIVFRWVNIEQDKSGEQFVLATNRGMRSIPTIVFPDGSILVEPSNRKLADKLGLTEKVFS
jgi:glutaredoxin-like protein